MLGCHEDTCTELELTEAEFKILIKIANENNKNAGRFYGCMPVIAIFKKYTYKDGYFDYDEKDSLVKVNSD